ncbi:MAG TPA: C25 family cysteine peptidase [Candidatus Cloacimonadota bacterium]|nr:C25 family cysteine peptidase [Candidatus Cloacimonadota bacterium]
MNRNNLTYLLLIVLVMIGSTAFLVAAPRQITIAGTPTQTTLASNDRYGMEIEFKVGELQLNEIKTKAGTFDEPAIEDYGFSNRIGEPKLPVLSKLIAVPIGADVTFSIVNSSFEILDREHSKLQNRIIPAQRSISKSEDPDKVPFVISDKVYGLDAFTANELFRVEEIGYMRGVRLFQIYYEPVNYNPVTGDLKITRDARIRIDFNHPDFAATEELLAKTASYEFNHLYEMSIFNWQANERTNIVRYPTKILILCPVGYTSNIQTYVDWKIQQGYNVVVASVGTGGTITSNTTSAIISYMQSVWSAATAQNPAPTYLLIIGDQSGTISIVTNTGVTGSHPTDLNYVKLQGSDYVPEMYFGRFSVSTTNELTAVINKTITFEKTQMSDLSYLGKAVMIAGQDATYGPTHGDGAINYGTTYYFNAAHGITSNTYLYATSGSATSAILANANEGRGYINYTAHGSETGWYSPAFTVTDAQNMTNTGKYGVMVGNCCLTNKFDYASGPCFGEALLRGSNKAAVAYIGGTNSTYWNEDYWWAVGSKGTANGSAPAYNAGTLGAYDAMFHTHGEAVSNWAQTTSEAIWMGNLAVTQASSSRINYYWEIYSIMGDPSLMPYYGVPTANTASYPNQITVGINSYTITGAAPYTRVGLSMNGTIYGSGVTDASGNLTLTITPFTAPGTATLVLTAQNRITVIANINVVTGAGPYITVSSVVYDDANNDVPEYNEAGYLDVTFLNSGTVTTTNVSAILTCTTSGITITDNSATIASLAANASTTLDNAYAFTIANNIANGTVANFTITMTMSGYDPWTYNFSMTIYAPVLAFGTITISDPSPGNNNGNLDPGETVTVTMPLTNTGGAASLSGSATLTSPTSGITINSGTANFSAITVSGSTNLSFSVSAASGMSVGTLASLVFNATAGAYSANKTESVTIGLIKETFETGNFSAFAWEQGTYPWTVVNTGAYAGTYCAQSGTITHSQSSTLQITRVLPAAGTLTFYYKVSSEATYDKLNFYVDGTMQTSSWSGEVAWTQASFSITSGTHTFKWEYAKDSSVSSGSDCAWLDEIVFPASVAYIPPTITWTPSSFTQELNPNQTATQNLTIGNTGMATLTYTVSRPTPNTTVLNESFENSGSIPLGWTQVYVSGSTAWTFVTGGYNSHPAAAYDGTYNARLYYTSSSGITTKLITPEINLAGAQSATLTFYHTQEKWANDQDELKVYYRTSSAGSWTQLAYYTSSIAAWTLETISLPNLSGTYQIAFEGIAKYGYGVCLDKVVVTKYTPVSITWLTVAGGESYSNSIASGGANQNVAIGFNSSGLSVGTYNTTLTLTSNSTTNSSVSIPVTLNVVNSAAANISVTPASLTYGSVATGSSSTQQFTIQNTGSATLTGTITTPTGYAVTLSRGAFEPMLTDAKARGIKESRNSLAFSINASQSKVFDLTFSPTLAQSYNGNVVISSNAVNYPTVNLAVTGSGYVPPTALLNLTYLETTIGTDNQQDLGFTICNTGSVDLTYSITLTGSPAWLSCSPMSSNVSPSVCFPVSVHLNASGLTPGNYNAGIILNSNDPVHPSQTIDVVMHVYQVNTPNWTVVTYPNNSATVYGIATIDGIPCQQDDYVGAFAGNECRAMAEVNVTRETAYFTLLVNLAADGENISFRIFDESANTVYPVLETYTLHFGEVIGGTTAVPVNAITNVSLETPVVTIVRTAQGTVLSWNAVNYAEGYKIYRSADTPYSGFTQIASVTGVQYTDTDNLPRAFYYVQAVRGEAVRIEETTK